MTSSAFGGAVLPIVAADMLKEARPLFLILNRTFMGIRTFDGLLVTVTSLCQYLICVECKQSERHFIRTSPVCKTTKNTPQEHYMSGKSRDLKMFV